LAAQRQRPELPALLDDSVRRLAAGNDQIEQQRHALTFGITSSTGPTRSLFG
jgi:hypothetical protein